MPGGGAGYKKLKDTNNTVRFAINVWAGWSPIVLANEGFKADMAGYLKGGRGVVAMSNADDGMGISAEGITALCRWDQMAKIESIAHIAATLAPLNRPNVLFLPLMEPSIPQYAPAPSQIVAST